MYSFFYILRCPTACYKFVIFSQINTVKHKKITFQLIPGLLWLFLLQLQTSITVKLTIKLHFCMSFTLSIICHLVNFLITVITWSLDDVCARFRKLVSFLPLDGIGIPLEH